MKLKGINQMEKLISKNYKIYYIPNNNVEEDLFYEFYKLKIEEHIIKTLSKYDVKENLEFIKEHWLYDILDTCDYYPDRLVNLEYYIKQNLSIYLDEKASNPKELKPGYYYFDYMETVPYICEMLQEGDKNA